MWCYGALFTCFQTGPRLVYLRQCVAVQFGVCHLWCGLVHNHKCLCLRVAVAVINVWSHLHSLSLSHIAAMNGVTFKKLRCSVACLRWRCHTLMVLDNAQQVCVKRMKGKKPSTDGQKTSDMINMVNCQSLDYSRTRHTQGGGG